MLRQVVVLTYFFRGIYRMRSWIDGYNSDIYQISDQWNLLRDWSHKVNKEELENAYKSIAELYSDLDEMNDPDLVMLEEYEQLLGEYERRD